MRPTHLCPIPEARDVKSLAPKIRSACSVLCCRAPKTVLDLAKMSFGGPRKLFGQKRALQGHQAVSKPKASEVIEKKNEDDYVEVCKDPRPVERSRRE